VGQAARSVESGAGISLGELIEFCARCAALGIPESTKLRAAADGEHALVALAAGTELPAPTDLMYLSGTEFGTIIEGGVDIDIPSME
jgi:tRNA threonylcarbamoyladenosine modification (KEOPS) complex Cgi121 subunit